MKKVLFTINGFQHPHIGYTKGIRWNGWATPHFEIDEALKVMEEFNSCEPEFPMTYDKDTDTFSVVEIGGGNGDGWKGLNYQTDEGIKHLYSIGAYSWVWEDITAYDIYNIARRIEDFLYEYDTYEYRNNYDDRELVVEEIKNQLKEFKTMKPILIYLYTEELKDEELYNALRRELKI